MYILKEGICFVSVWLPPMTPKKSTTASTASIMENSLQSEADGILSYALGGPVGIGKDVPFQFHGPEGAGQLQS